MPDTTPSDQTNGAADAATTKRSVRLGLDEAWQRIEAAHTGIVTTLRRDGTPITLPLWFVVLDRHVYFSTPSGSKKVARVRNDSRSSFLVESGERWAELAAVHLTGRTTIVDDEAIIERVNEATERKYAAFRTARREMPEATRQKYGRSSTYLCFTPDERIVSWDNSRLFT